MKSREKSRPRITVSADFHQIQYLNLQTIESYSTQSSYSTKTLKAIVNAAPRLQRLVVNKTFDFCLWYEDIAPNLVEDDLGVGNEQITVLLDGTRSENIKQKFEKSINNWFTCYSSADRQYLTVALASWMTRTKAFEVSLQIDVEVYVPDHRVKYYMWVSRLEATPRVTLLMFNHHTDSQIQYTNPYTSLRTR
jgi:hypothetical protein